MTINLQPGSYSPFWGRDKFKFNSKSFECVYHPNQNENSLRLEVNGAENNSKSFRLKSKPSQRSKGFLSEVVALS